MKRTISLIVITGLLFSFAGCKKSETAVSESISEVNVTVEKAKIRKIESTATYVGEIKASGYSGVSAKVSGTVESIYKEIGDYVYEGDVVLKIDDADYDLSYRQAKIEYDDAQVNLNNYKILYDNGAVSKLSLDSAQKRFENARITLEKAQKALSDTSVKAPISGYIASKNLSVGQLVSPGIELFSIKDTDKLNAEINVTESVIRSIKIGSKAVINPSSSKEGEIKGEVTSFSPAKNDKTGMYTVIIEIDNNEETVSDGMFAEIKLTLDEKEDCLTVLSDSIMEDEEGKQYVYIAEDNKAKRVYIESGITNDKYTEVLSGIEEGMDVIVSGKEYLSEENNSIKIVKE